MSSGIDDDSGWDPGPPADLVKRIKALENAPMQTSARRIAYLFVEHRFGRVSIGDLEIQVQKIIQELIDSQAW